MNDGTLGFKNARVAELEIDLETIGDDLVGEAKIRDEIELLTPDSKKGSVTRRGLSNSKKYWKAAEWEAKEKADAEWDEFCEAEMDLLREEEDRLDPEELTDHPLKDGIPV
jgi:hypothetical protein